MADQKSSTKPTTTRRDFLKTSAATAAAVGSLSIGRGAHAAGDETIKIGMIGCGGRCSGAAAQSLKAGPYVKLAAMYEIFDTRLAAARKNLSKQFPDQVRSYPDLAIATAVTWDQQSGVYDYTGHQQRAKSRLPGGIRRSSRRSVLMPHGAVVSAER